MPAKRNDGFDSGEVRYERMRPAQIRQAREACPAVYIPLGSLEWHERHAPVGLDGLKAHALAIRCARAGGGLVWPTLHYGENREGELIEMFEEHQEGIARHMGIPPSSFAPGYMGRSVPDQVLSYYQLLMHLLMQARSLGFKVIVFVAGHYPLAEHARVSCRLFYHHCCRTAGRAGIPATFVFSDQELARDLFPECADHAGFWETSLLMALDPGLVDLDALPKRERDRIGILASKRPVTESNAEFGERAVRGIVGRAVQAVRERLADPARFEPR